jgi:GTP-binding protein Era
MQEKMMTDTPETDASPAEPQGPTRSGFVALIGAPNAGKSTLMNQLVGAKVSIVSHKVQTTRAIVRGIAIHDRTQIVFIDTPGIFTPKRRLDRAMVTTAWGGAKDGDLVLVLIDAERGIKGDAEALLDSLAERQGRTILVINKIDQVKRDTLLALTAAIHEKARFDQTFMISALNGSGCKDLMDYLAKTLPEGPWYYPEDQISDLPMRQLAAEITREKLFLRLPPGTALCLACRDGKLGREEGRLGAHRAGHLCRAREPEEDRPWPQGRDHQGHRPGIAQGNIRDPRAEGAPVPVRQGPRELGQ